MTVHEFYRHTRHTTGANDIALVRLRDPAVTIMEDIKSIVLPICMDFRREWEQEQVFEQKAVVYYMSESAGDYTN